MFMRSRFCSRIILLLAKDEHANIMLTTQNKELRKCDGIMGKTCRWRVGCVGSRLSQLLIFARMPLSSRCAIDSFQLPYIFFELPISLQ